MSSLGCTVNVLQRDLICGLIYSKVDHNEAYFIIQMFIIFTNGCDLQNSDM